MSEVTVVYIPLRCHSMHINICNQTLSNQNQDDQNYTIYSQNRNNVYRLSLKQCKIVNNSFHFCLLFHTNTAIGIRMEMYV